MEVWSEFGSRGCATCDEGTQGKRDQRVRDGEKDKTVRGLESSAIHRLRSSSE
jgi:hypothetical protein